MIKENSCALFLLEREIDCQIFSKGNSQILISLIQMLDALTELCKRTIARMEFCPFSLIDLFFFQLRQPPPQGRALSTATALARTLLSHAIDHSEHFRMKIINVSRQFWKTWELKKLFDDSLSLNVIECRLLDENENYSFSDAQE